MLQQEGKSRANLVTAAGMLVLFTAIWARRYFSAWPSNQADTVVGLLFGVAIGLLLVSVVWQRKELVGRSPGGSGRP